MNYLLLSVVVVIYLVVTGILAYAGFKGTKTSTDYLLAGRRIHPAVMALSYGATFISTSAIVGFGGAAAVYGMGVLWLTVLNIAVGILIAFAVFGLRTRKMGHNLDAHTFPELLAKRYDSRFLQLAGGLVIFVAMPLYAGSVIIGGAQFVAQTLTIPYEVALIFFVAIVALYVIMGGMKGVMYTDAFQGTLMFIGMAFLLIWTYTKLGGVQAAHERLTALAPEAVKVFGAAGHKGWTAMPTFGSPYWMQLVTTIVMGVGIGVLAQPQLTVRFMTVKSGHELNRAVLIGGVFIMMMTGVAFTVGALTNLYFHETLGKIALLAAEKKTDNIIPLYINKAMPSWFTAFFLITLLAAAMSTLSSQFHAMGTAFGRDFLEKGSGLIKKPSVAVNRITMGVAILISTLVAYLLPKFYAEGSAIIATGTAIFFGLCASAFLPLYVGALYIKRMTKAAAVSSFIMGTAASLFWLGFVHIKESKPLGLCQFIFGLDSLASNVTIQNMDPLLVGLPLSALTAIIVSLATKAPEELTLARAFKGIGKK